jgi:hypothetical protein
VPENGILNEESLFEPFLNFYWLSIDDCCAVNILTFRTLVLEFESPFSLPAPTPPGLLKQQLLGP